MLITRLSKADKKNRPGRSPTICRRFAKLSDLWESKWDTEISWEIPPRYWKVFSKNRNNFRKELFSPKKDGAAKRASRAQIRGEWHCLVWSVDGYSLGLKCLRYSNLWQIHHVHQYNSCEVVSPQVEAMQARRGLVCLKRLLSRTDESYLHSVNKLLVYKLQV